MKIWIFTFVLFCCSMGVYAQIPNGGFEQWESYSDDSCAAPAKVYQKPDGWNGSLPRSCQAYSYSLSKNNDNFPSGTGQFSLKIQADTTNGVRGVAISNDGHDKMVNWIPKPSFPISNRPAYLNLYYKYLPFGGDTMIIQVYFYKNGAVIGNPVFGTSDTISNWTALQIPMSYTTSAVPDSATILIVTGVYVEHPQTVLYLDNLSFSGTSSIGENRQVTFQMYPNPASGKMNIRLPGTTRQNGAVHIYSLTGVLLLKEELTSGESQLNVAQLANGVYIVEVLTNEFSSKQKLVVQH